MLIINENQNKLNNNGDMYVYDAALKRTVALSGGVVDQVLTKNANGSVRWATPTSPDLSGYATQAQLSSGLSEELSARTAEDNKKITGYHFNDYQKIDAIHMDPPALFAYAFISNGNQAKLPNMNYLDAGSGSWTKMGNLLIQWGYFPNTNLPAGYSGYTVNLYVPYITLGYGLQITPFSGINNETSAAWVNSKSLGSFTFAIDNYRDRLQSTGVCWFTIGLV